ncbi:GatB/YqeY domain-containing protein [Desulfonatronum sp. SC1]|uniref:GatB/YqeY domain-containing protein n=1 Tax=Desulfonatronum sp. SC1 TaxID=2109626 RepID=UPI000D3007D1|nr:GatB/YqeY domain-containing protein [Desulfonatronum sp. SC1]PTN37703.1 glutamyl-tRNA amidotransferase [Desulfonatronum sp. SC1]
MSLQERIERDFIAAYKNKDTVLVAVLRMLKTATKNRQVDLQRLLSDDEVLDLVLKQIKQRQESIDMYSKAGRDELAAKEAAELELLRAYQPQPLSADELTALIETVVSEQGATSIKDMGRVIQAIMNTHKGRVDGKAVSELVRNRLSS